MLILSRRPGESITIYTENGKVTVKVCRFEGNQVKVGIEAPNRVNIRRSELENKPKG